eukprot:ANDGO_08151.mRNA.1 Acyl-protein thioesterase 1
MPAWYDILGLTVDAKEDETGLRESRDAVHALVNEEKKLIPTSRIFIGGFSQGGAIALYSALTSKDELGGCIALSSYLPRIAQTERKTDGAFLKVFMGHGDADSVVQYRWGLQSKEALQRMQNVQVDFRTYRGMDHSACQEEIDDIRKFLDNIAHTETAQQQ